MFDIASVLRYKILKDLNPMQRKFWYDISSLFTKFSDISAKFLHLDENPTLNLKMTKEEKSDFVQQELRKIPKKLPSHIYLPTNPNTKILEIIPDSAFSLQSAKKVPFIVSFQGQSYDGPDSDYISTTMNITEYIMRELANYENTIRRNASIVALPSQNILDVNTHYNSKYLNKSTSNTGYRDNDIDNMRLNPMITDDNNTLNHSNLLEEDPFMFGEQEELQDLTIPHIDIKIFNKNDQMSINAEIRESSNGFNINDLSECTDEDITDEIVNMRETSKNIY